jgi:phage gp36-like protein
MSQYATTDDLADLGLQTGWLGDITTDEQDAALEKASGVLDDFLRTRFVLPLSAPYPDSLIRATVDIAVYYLMKRRGFNPSGGDIDALIVKGYDDAIIWGQRVARGELVIGAIDTTPDTSDASPEVYSVGESGSSRGW